MRSLRIVLAALVIGCGTADDEELAFSEEPNFSVDPLVGGMTEAVTLMPMKCPPEGCPYGTLCCRWNNEQVCLGYCPTPSCLTCADLPGRCGTFSNNCGGTITCSCGGGEICSNTYCQPEPRGTCRCGGCDSAECYTPGTVEQDNCAPGKTPFCGRCKENSHGACVASCTCI